MDKALAVTMLITFIVAAIIAVTGGTVIETLQDDWVGTQTDTFTNVTNTTVYNLSYTSNEFIGSSIADVTLAFTNASCSDVGSTLSLTGTYPGITLAFNCTDADGEDFTAAYDYKTSEEAYDSTENAIGGIANITGLLPALGVTIAIVILLSILFLVWKPGYKGV